MIDNSSRGSVWQAIRTILAADCACSEEAFSVDGVTIIEWERRPGRRAFAPPSKPLQIITMGTGVAVAAHSDRLELLGVNLQRLDRDAIFSATTIALLAQYIERDGQYLRGPELKHSCSRSDIRPAVVPNGVTVTLVERADIPDLYQHRGFNHALSYSTDYPRPDMLATVAILNGDLVGIACAGADSDVLWQIGVDVTETARGRGIGRALVGRLTEGIFDCGRIPYYSTTVANLRSRALVTSLGYWPAWTEMYARDRP